MFAKEIDRAGLTGSLRVLIVDDVEDDALLMVSQLEAEGFAPVARRVDNPDDFRAALAQPWDVVLCDYAMPRFGPGEVLHLLRRRAPQLPLIMVSGIADEDAALRMMRGGARDFVAKSNLERLGTVVRRELKCPLSPPATTTRPAWRVVLERLERLIARRGERPFALIALDVERFRRITHGLGYARGERLLDAVAGRLLAHGGLYLGRLYGDEFLLALPLGPEHRPLDQAVAQLRAELARPFFIDDSEVFLGFSLGLAHFPGDAREPEALLRHAEAAVLDARRGENRAPMPRGADSVRRLSLEQELHRALERSQFHLNFQPQVAIDGARLLGMEALLRWDHPDLGAISPAHFIPLAEETGLIVEIGRWVLDQACAEAARWHRGGAGALRVGVNLSACQFRHGDLAAVVEGALARHGLAGSALELELTESVVIGDPDGVTGVLHQCREMGVRTAVDDFGTGYSSLSYLRHLPLDVLKIDRSFVSELGRDPRADAVVEALVGMSRRLGMETIAEGVETQAQAVALLGLGCPAAQGYYYGRPVGAEQAIELIGGAVTRNA